MKRQQQSKRERAFCSTIEMSSRHDARVERLRKTQVAQAESLDAMASASGASPDKEGLQEDAPKAQPRLSKATRTMGSLMFKARRSTAGPVPQPLATQLSTEGAQPLTKIESDDTLGELRTTDAAATCSTPGAQRAKESEAAPQSPEGASSSSAPSTPGGSSSGRHPLLIGWHLLRCFRRVS